MRPLRLSFYGLHSFKEEQVIDFTLLGEGKVFGIFGPTGSGKSTIIDAITLALYGKVERAPDKTKGIINASLAEAGVRFEFSVGIGAECTTYRVERKFVAKEDSIFCRLARLSDISSPEASVLADKQKLVDEKVEDLLGLTVDDFTRAVVLPQGKFAEFLSLRGKERREMLERIFGLSAYGERLLAIANNRAKAVEAQVSKLQGEQQGLGEASAEALLNIRYAVLEASTSLTKAMQSLSMSKELWDEAKVVMEAQERLERLETQSAALSAVWEHISALQSNSKRLEAADGVWPFLTEFDETEKTLVRARERRGLATRFLTESVEHERLASAAAWGAKWARQNEEPQLLARQHDLKRAMALAEELREHSRLLQGERQITDAVVVRLATAEEQLEGILARERKAVQLRTQLRIDGADNEVSLEERASLDVALQVEGTWQEAKRKLSERVDEENVRRVSLEKALSVLLQAQQNVVILEQDYNQVKLELGRLEQSCPPEISAEQQEAHRLFRLTTLEVKNQNTQEQRLLARQDSLNQKKGLLEEQLGRLQEAILRASERVATFRFLLAQNQASLKAAKDACLVAELATLVAPGEKCPVCGSRSHPELATPQTPANLEHLEEAVDETRSLLEKDLAEEARVTANAESSAKEISELTAQLDAVMQELALTRAEMAKLKRVFPAVWVGLSLEDIESNINLEVKYIESAQEERRLSLGRLEKARQAERLLADKLAKTAEAHAIAQHHVANLQIEFDILQEKVKAQILDENSARKAYDEWLVRLGLGDIKEYKDSLSAKDRKQKELSDTLRQLEDKLLSLQLLRQESEKALALIQDELASHRLKIEGWASREWMLATELKSLVGDASPLVQAQVVEASLQTLRDKERDTEEFLTMAKAEVSQKRSEEASAIEALRLAEDACERARLKLEQNLFDAGLKSREEVLALRVDVSKRELWEQEVKTYLDQRTLVESERAALNRVLAGRSMSAAEWTALDAAYLSCQNSRDAALHTLGQVEARLKDISERHDRFVVLEEQRKTLVKERDLVVELCALLRGNALVEFMAGEHLQAVTASATEWLGILSSHRYALEVDPDGVFVMRDDGQGSLKRGVHTLSGGETFITSLALALALSLHIQLRGKFPLEFFFLDEGFGTLDSELLETVICCLERMQRQNLSIGIISHVQELMERTARKIIVTPAEHGGRGSKIKIV